METKNLIIEGQKVELETRGLNINEQSLIEAFLATKTATQCAEYIVGNKRLDVKLTSSFLTTANTFNEQGLANPNPFWDEMARERDLETIREFNRGEISKDELQALLKGEVK